MHIVNMTQNDSSCAMNPHMCLYIKLHYEWCQKFIAPYIHYEVSVVLIVVLLSMIIMYPFLCPRYPSTSNKCPRLGLACRTSMGK